ncbi:hypothetical protein A2880_01210 [Candidatus Peribacteria bacterium RIFCSPHIGHO2_01_FULL_49_38]|nr:MAG: hypothetical protein A2880_01210 [Candidatus Peribacteria bacterium RIFCSPHIGHO2_01_FULL_49_38]
MGDSTTGCDFGGIFGSTANTSYNMKIEGLSTGDAVSDVRPGGTVTGNFHRVANAELTIAVKQLTTSDTTVKNAKNVNLLRFEARAGEAEDILLTKAIFDSESGSLLNGQNYTLWADTDGDGAVDTILEKGVASASSKISFQKLAGGGYVIPAEATIVFEVHSDIAASITNDDLQLRFASAVDPSGYIEAEEVDDGSNLSGITTDGTCSSSNCSVIVSTTSSTLWSLTNQGDLFVIKDTTPIRARQLLGGTLGDAILRLQFRAQNEDVDVTDLQFTSSGGQALSVDRLELYKEGETTKFGEATIGGCGSDDVLTHDNQGNTAKTFCANMESRQLVVKEGQNLNVIVRPRIKTDLQGAVSNNTISFFISKQAVSNESSGSGAVRARGMQSNNNLDANSGDSTAAGEIFIGRSSANATNLDITGQKNAVVLAKVTTITNANPDPDNTNVPTGVAPFGQFKFTSASNSNTLNGVNKFVLSDVVFNVNATQVGMDTSKFFVYNKADATQKTSCTPYQPGTTTEITGGANAASGSFVVSCTDLDTSVVNTTLDPGASMTLVLEGNIDNAKLGSVASSLQSSIQGFSDNSQTSFGTTSGASHVQWDDQDTSTTTFTWIEYPETVVKSTSYKS